MDSDNQEPGSGRYGRQEDEKNWLTTSICPQSLGRGEGQAPKTAPDQSNRTVKYCFVPRAIEQKQRHLTQDLIIPRVQVRHQPWGTKSPGEGSGVAHVYGTSVKASRQGRGGGGRGAQCTLSRPRLRCTPYPLVMCAGPTYKACQRWDTSFANRKSKGDGTRRD